MTKFILNKINLGPIVQRAALWTPSFPKFTVKWEENGYQSALAKKPMRNIRVQKLMRKLEILLPINYIKPKLRE